MNACTNPGCDHGTKAGFACIMVPDYGSSPETYHCLYCSCNSWRYSSAAQAAASVPEEPVQVDMTFSDLERSLRNIGYDINCGACAEVFFCGSTAIEHGDACESRLPVVRI